MLYISIGNSTAITKQKIYGNQLGISYSEAHFLFAARCFNIYILAAKMSNTVANRFFRLARLFGLSCGTTTYPSH